jgi:hypothetical protein
MSSLRSRSKSSKLHAWEGRPQAGAGSWVLWQCTRCRTRWRLPAGVHPEPGECGSALVARGSEDRKDNGRDDEYRRFVREEGCCLAPYPLHVCSGRIDCHHVASKGAGWSDWLPDGRGNLVGACRINLHRLLSEVNWGRTRLEEMFDVDFAQLAADTGDRYKSNGP